MARSKHPHRRSNRVQENCGLRGGHDQALALRSPRCRTFGMTTLNDPVGILPAKFLGASSRSLDVSKLVALMSMAVIAPVTSQ
jgi:hypothetical protein